MKKYLTIVLTEKAEFSAPDSVEIICRDENGIKEEFFLDSISKASGKYFLYVDGVAEINAEAIEEFVSSKDSGADIVAFDNCYAIKTSIIKQYRPKAGESGVLAKINALIAAKSVSRVQLSPFKISFKAQDFDQTEILSADESFNRAKGKMDRQVYMIAFDELIRINTEHYLFAYLKGCAEKNFEEIIAFDKKLKENVVLYLAVEKRFPVGNLHKMRENGFKSSLILSGKVKNYLKKTFTT